MLFPIAILLILAMLLWLPGLPFGTKKNMPVYIEQGILALDRIYINGDWRGYLVGLDPRLLERLLPARAVQCALEE
jgi:prolyl-tRNA editing enzyme YbaK/EbsC (Cys-tRNA(Pro) deacylase)